jgi:hypothetical protein
MQAADKVPQKSAYAVKVSLFCFSLLLVCYCFLRLTWAVSMAPMGEAFGIALFLFIFLQISSVRSYILSLPGPIAMVFTIFFFVFCLCHCMAIPRTTFPFVPWNMYSTETRFSDLVKFYRYEAITVSGKKVSIKPELYFRSLSSGRIITDLDGLVTSINSYDASKEKDLFKARQVLIDDFARKQGGVKGFLSWFRLNIYEENLFTLPEKEHHLNEILNAIASRYDAWHPDDPLSGIDIIKGVVDISQGPKARAAYSNIWHLSLSKGGQ